MDPRNSEQGVADLEAISLVRLAVVAITVAVSSFPHYITKKLTI